MSYAKSIDFLFNQMRSNLGDLAGGEIYFYSAGTTSTPKAVWTDRAKTLPTVLGVYSYTLTANGTAELFGEGLYYIVVKNSSGVTVYDYDYVSLYQSPYESAAASDTALVDATSANQTYTLGTSVTPFTVIREGASAYFCRIYPPTGYTLATGTAYRSLDVANESVTFNLIGTVFYEA